MLRIVNQFGVFVSATTGHDKVITRARCRVRLRVTACEARHTPAFRLHEVMTERWRKSVRRKSIHRMERSLPSCLPRNCLFVSRCCIAGRYNHQQQGIMRCPHRIKNNRCRDGNSEPLRRSLLRIVVDDRRRMRRPTDMRHSSSVLVRSRGLACFTMPKRR